MINGYNQYGGTEETVNKLKNFLESIGYRGFCEFDLKYDSREKDFKVMEINPRQARSSYYLCALGHNLIKMLLEDVFEGKEHEFELLTEEFMLHMVPKNIIKKYIANDEYREEALKLWKAHKHVDPMHFKKDKSFKQRLYLKLRAFNYKKKYRTNTHTI